MNKPKVYGFCDAGCKWRVPHYSEFETSAAFIPLVANEDGDFILEIGKTYKIKNANASGELGFTVGIYESATDSYCGNVALTYDKYANGVSLRILEVKPIDSDGFILGLLSYEQDGTRHTEQQISASAITSTFYAKVSGATDCCLYNEYAQAKAKDGESITITDVSESAEDGGSNVVSFSDGTQLTVKNGSKGVASKYDCSSGVQNANYSQAYLKITVPNQSTIFDLIVKVCGDGGGEGAGLYDFMTWRLHIRPSFCSVCATTIQDATSGAGLTLHYGEYDPTSDDYIDIYLGFSGCCIEVYINGILETISATFETVATLPSGATAFTIK